MPKWSVTGATAPAHQALAQAGARGGTRLRVLAAITVGALVSVTAAGAAQADDIYNTIDSTIPAQAIDAQAEQMPLASGGAAGTTTLRVQARNSSIDGFEGCNMLKGPVTFSIRSSDTAVATVTPSTVEFTACTPVNGPVQEKVLTVTPLAAGSATITATVLSNPGPGTFNTTPATFVVNVAPPPNSPPSVEVVDVEHGGHYFKGGAVPTPMCESTDVEDGTTRFAPALSRPSQLPDGLGERVAKCTYTDSRGATAVSSASYFIDDPDAPKVRYVLSVPKPTNGWYRGEVALEWIVTEPESPNTLVTEGCERQWVTSDQKPSTYTCTAKSEGGTAVITSEPIGKDATPPTVTGTITSPSHDVNGLTWYAEAPQITWGASDPVSGVLDGSVRPTVTVSGEGRNKMARTVATDNAGNTGGTSIQYLNIDASAPVVEAALASTPAYTDGTGTWFKDEATFNVTARDPDVQPFERGSGLKGAAASTEVVTESTDFVATAEDNVGHVGTSNTVPVKVDAKAPTVDVTCPTTPVVKGSTSATASWTAADEVGGSGLAGASSGTVRLDTTTVGARSVSAPTATDKVGHSSAAAGCDYRVVYAYSGFFAPVDNNGTWNKVKAGSTVPVKFSLGGDQGLAVLSGTPVATKVSCSPSALTDSLEETSATTTSGLKYDATAGHYIYTWKTANSLAGTCQKLTVKLADGTSQSALFTFTK